MKNVVFRSIEGRWRGPLPCSRAELTLGIVVFLVLTPETNLLVGGVVALVAVGGLVVWRRLDHDRSDYVTALLRRCLERTRAYNTAEPDDGFVPFDPR